MCFLNVCYHTKEILPFREIKMTYSSGTNLRDILTKTKTTPPPHLTLTLYTKSSATNALAPASYDGHAYRSVH